MVGSGLGVDGPKGPSGAPEAAEPCGARLECQRPIRCEHQPEKGGPEVPASLPLHPAKEMSSI